MVSLWEITPSVYHLVFFEAEKHAFKKKQDLVYLDLPTFFTEEI